MRTPKVVAKISIIAILSSLFPVLVNIQSAWACSTAPGVPIVKTIWGATGGPTFSVTLFKSGELPDSIYYTYAIQKAGKDRFEPFVDWVQVPVKSQVDLVTFVAPISPQNEVLAFTAYAANSCGNSGQNQVYRKLVTGEKLLISKLDIADDLPLSVGMIPAYFFSPNGYENPRTVTSKNPAICSFDESTKALKLISAGKCEFTISQNSEQIQTPNPDVTQVINILPAPIILADALKDRPDEIPGFQIHVVYVKVKDITPHEYYRSGDINNWLDLANAWMKRKIGKESIFDTYQGAYDISTMSTQYLPKELDKDSPEGGYRSGKKGALEKLRVEFNKQNGGVLQGKNLLFIIDAKIGTDYCGFGTMPGEDALTTPGAETCWSSEWGYFAQTTKLNSASTAIAHELIHNLGVDHVCTAARDLMLGDEGCKIPMSSVETSIDSENQLYVGAAKAGANILDMKVWKDGSGLRHIKSAGACYINEPCSVSEGVWPTFQSDLEIQEKIGGKWKTIQTFKVKKLGPKKYVFNASITPRAPGLHIYREYLAPTKKYSAYVGKEFTRNVLS